jgi:hypothetical protein
MRIVEPVSSSSGMWTADVSSSALASSVSPRSFSAAMIIERAPSWGGSGSHTASGSSAHASDAAASAARCAPTRSSARRAVVREGTTR